MELEIIENKNSGGVYATENNKQIGEMTFTRAQAVLTVNHTGVLPQYRGQGVAKKLFDKLIEKVKKEELKIIPQCSYVALMFKRDTSLSDYLAV